MDADAGAGVIRDAQGRRIRERDRRGTDVARLTWAADGALAEASVRLPDGRWLSVQPRAMQDGRWGDSDVLRCGDAPITHFAAVDWARVALIPPLAEPARLPPGAGTAVLNLLAALAADQGRDRLAYRGPYPTEQLFVALLESFRWQPGDKTAPDDPRRRPDPLREFMAGGLTWSPAPHARAWAPGGVYVQSRERIEKVVWRGRVYVRSDWQGVARRAAHRVHEVAGRVHCSLWALGSALEDHLILTQGGDVLQARAPAAGAGPSRPLAAEVAAGLVAVVVASSAPPLSGALRAVADDLAFEWAPLAGDLATVGDARVAVSSALLAALRARLARTSCRAERVGLGFGALAELAAALGDPLRARAQAHLAAATADEQAQALGALGAAGAGAPEIGRAVEALLEAAAQPLA